MLSTCSTPSLLSDFETCPRKGHWASRWTACKLKSSQMVSESILTALLATEGTWGEIAGSEVMQLAQDRGMDTETPRLFDSAVHHAALSDLIVSSVRKPNDPPWLIPPPVQSWIPDCFMSPDGRTLRRIVLVSNWSDARHYSECRSWRTLGEVAHYELPMSLIVAVIGSERDGIRSGPWTTGFLHPQNHQLRFRKRSKGTKQDGNVFNDSWQRVHREDHAEISRETWLESMLRDDVLREVLFRVDIPVPSQAHLLRIRQMAAAKLDRLSALKEVPDGNLSTCDFPVPCVFRGCCHVIPERCPSESEGFIRL